MEPADQPDGCAEQQRNARFCRRFCEKGGVVRLADALLRSGTLPEKARVDALHVGVAAVNGIDYLLTWNLRHLANAAIRGKIEQAVRDAGMVPPIICTPEELMESKS